MTEQSLTFACGIDALRPRPLATLPHVDSPSDSKRARHARTETTVTPRSAAIHVFATPSAAASSSRTTSRRGLRPRDPVHRLPLALGHRRRNGSSAHP